MRSLGPGAPCELRPKVGGKRSFRRHLRAISRGVLMPHRTPRGSRRSDNRRRRPPATCDQDRGDRDDGPLNRLVSLPSWTARCARSCASSSPSPAFALMRSMMPSPSRRAASSTSESRRPVRAARTRTWRRRPSSIERVVFTFAIFPYCHTRGWLSWSQEIAQRRGVGGVGASPCSGIDSVAVRSDSLVNGRR